MAAHRSTPLRKPCAGRRGASAGACWHAARRLLARGRIRAGARAARGGLCHLRAAVARGAAQPKQRGLVPARRADAARPGVELSGGQLEAVGWMAQRRAARASWAAQPGLAGELADDAVIVP